MSDTEFESMLNLGLARMEARSLELRRQLAHLICQRDRFKEAVVRFKMLQELSSAEE
jgi:hypothetical protein